MKSCIYEGVVRHRRASPIDHAFRYRLFMMYLDLAELPALFSGRWFWSNEGRKLARFRRADHLKELSKCGASPLDEAVRILVERRIGRRPTGPIRLLTHLEYFRYRINPVSFYYCYDKRDQRVEAIIAEINNTPWGEQHCYVLDATKCAPNESMRFLFAKAFHISPFMDMGIDYDWRFTNPGDQLVVSMANYEQGNCIFDVSMVMQRRGVSTRSLASALARHPFMTLKVAGAIYYQALRLWLKRCPFFPHPALRKATGGNSAC